MSVGELLPIRTEDHRDMGEDRRLCPKGLVEDELPCRIRQVADATDHMGDLHPDIVDDDGEVVGWEPIGAHDDAIPDLGALEFDPASDLMLDHDTPPLRTLEPEGGLPSFPFEPESFVLSQSTAAPIVTDGASLNDRLSPAHF